jgi:hypothetical protein
MRTLLVPAVLVASMACGGVDDAPLGGPYGGQTDPTDPNGGSNDSNTNNNNNNSGQDSGTTNTQKDSGTTQQKDSGSTTIDSGGPPPPMDSGMTPTAPTWTSIFNNYMAGGKEGRCSSCHSQGSSATNLYSWLQGRGYISGSSSALVDSSQSCLSWYGGNMPPSGPNDAKAVSDMNAWAAAGAANN